MIFSMFKQGGLWNIPVMSETSRKKLSKDEGTPLRFTLKVMPVTFLPVCMLSLRDTTCETRKNFYTPKPFFVLEKIKI